MQMYSSGMVVNNLNQDKTSLHQNSDMIRCINDPEHPLTLEELNVVENAKVQVRFMEYVFRQCTVHAYTCR